MSLWVERAENLDMERLESIVPINTWYIKYLESYIFSDSNYPLFLLGRKGSGKTFVTMKALGNVVRKNEKILPVMFIYKKDSMQVLNPLQLAPLSVWGERYEIYESYESKEDLLKEANVIVEDDFHYRCENVVKGKEKPMNLINDVQRFLEEVKSGKKGILISEEPLSRYASKLKLNGLYEILPHLGQLPRIDEIPYKQYEKLRNKWNPTATVEILPYDFNEWTKLFESYGVIADDLVSHLLYFLNSLPRAFVRFFKLFQPEKKVTIGDVVRKARELLPQKEINKKRKDFYWFLLNFPVIGSYKEVENILCITSETNLKTIKMICREAAKLITPPKTPYDENRWKRNPVYALRTKGRENWVEVDNALRKVIWEKMRDVERESEIMKMAKLYCSLPDWKDVELKKMLKKYVSRFWREFDGNYIRCGYGKFVLAHPFHEIFYEELYEKTSMEIIDFILKEV